MRFPKPIRLHPQHYGNRDEQFHLTINAHPKFQSWSAAIRELLWESILEQRESDRIHLYAACLMPDHVHMLVAPATQDLILFVNAWKSWTTRRAWNTGNRGPLWQPGMWDRTIRDEDDLYEVADYIVGNPVKAGLVSLEADWPYSWIWWRERQSRCRLGRIPSSSAAQAATEGRGSDARHPGQREQPASVGRFPG